MATNTNKLSTPESPAQQYGFTLTELMMALAIGTILTTMAVPAFSTMLEENRMVTQIYGFIGQLNYARAEAISRNREVALCKSTDGKTCNNDLEWEDGWIIFVDLSGDHKKTDDEPLLRLQGGTGIKLTINYSANLGLNNYVAFRPIGNSVGNGTFTFCSPQSEIKPRAVILARTGKARFGREKPNGDPLSCPN